MAFGARILADSVEKSGDNRLISFEVTHPRYVLAEVNTHRMLSKNSASSRAIPVATMLSRLKEDPYIPVVWGSNKKGMQAGEELDELDQKYCLDTWLEARDDAMKHAARLRKIGLHKQDANRLLEPFMWHTAILSGTEWSNFYNLRNHPHAHPAFQTFAAMMQELAETSEPDVLEQGQWHLPLVDEEEKNGGLHTPVSVSTGRCARVSYLTHDGKRDPEADVGLHDTLGGNGHMSPYEHQARPATKEDIELATVRATDIRIDHSKDPAAHSDSEMLDVDPKDMWFGNFRGWVQYRKTIEGESDMLGYLADKDLTR